MYIYIYTYIYIYIYVYDGIRNYMCIYIYIYIYISYALPRGGRRGKAPRTPHRRGPSRESCRGGDAP